MQNIKTREYFPSKQYMPSRMFRSASTHLTIYSPSSTTISYTVSDALPRSTRLSKIFVLLSNVFRLLLCLFVLAVDFAKLHSIHTLQHWPLDVISLQNTVPGRLAFNIAKYLDWRLIASGSFLVVYLCLRKGHTGKSVDDHHSLNLRADSIQRRRF
jgi:phosphatidylinositol N-acetylglucosaminyltransferase subunit H